MNTHTTALLLIDFQNDFCAPGGYADQCEGLDWVNPILPIAEKLLHGARRLGIQVIHTREGYLPDLSDCPPLRLARSREAGAAYGEQGPMGRFMIRGEKGQDFLPAMQAQAGEWVYDKPSYGAFCSTTLEADLRKAGIDTLAIAGVTADVCVHTTLREATDRGFDCIYLRDAISAFDPEIRKACEQMIVQEGGIWGRMMETTDFLEVLEHS